MSGQKYIRFNYSYITLFLIFFCSIINAQKSSLEFNGTTIVCIARNDTVWVGADSQYQDTSRRIKFHRCKIFVGDSLIIAHGGLNIFRHDDFQFDVHSIINQSVYKGKSKVINNSALTIGNFNYKISKLLEKAGNLEIKNRKYTPGDTLKDLVIKTITVFPVDNIIQIQCYTFLTIVSKDSSIFTYAGITDTFSTHKNRYHYIINGVNNYINRLGGMGKVEDIPFTLNCIISIASYLNPTLVGKPIDIVRMTKDKIEWVQHHDYK